MSRLSSLASSVLSALAFVVFPASLVYLFCTGHGYVLCAAFAAALCAPLGFAVGALPVLVPAIVAEFLDRTFGARVRLLTKLVLSLGTVYILGLLSLWAIAVGALYASSEGSLLERFALLVWLLGIGIGPMGIMVGHSPDSMTSVPNAMVVSVALLIMLLLLWAGMPWMPAVWAYGVLMVPGAALVVGYSWFAFEEECASSDIMSALLHRES